MTSPLLFLKLGKVGRHTSDCHKKHSDNVTFLDLLTAGSLFPPSPQLFPLFFPIAISSRDSLTQDLKCPFSEKNNAWIVSFNKRSLWLLWAPQTKYVYLFVLIALQRSLVMTPPCKAHLCSMHHSWPSPYCHSETASCHSHFLLRKKISRGAQDLLTYTWMQITTRLCSSNNIERSAFFPSLLMSSSSQAAFHDPGF